MTATNHALTGAAIGLIAGQPLIALPAALASHFVCDALPHFRSAREGESFLRASWFVRYLVAEVVLCGIVVLSLYFIRPLHWQLAAACAFVAASPDLISYKRFKLARLNKRYTPGLYVRFASRIQWFERPIGAVVEVAWFAAAIIIILPFVR
jgi:hypothetical protein